MTAWSLRRRLTFAVVGIVGLVLVGFAAALFVATTSAAWSQHDAGLVSRAAAIAAGTEHDDGRYELTLPQDAAHARPTYVMAWSPDDTVFARSAALGTASLPHPPLVAGAPRFFDLALPDGRRGRAVEVEARPHEEDGTPSARTISVVLAEGTEDVEAAIGRVRTAFLAAGALALVAVAAATVWLLKRGLDPLTTLGAQLEKIDDRTLMTRLRLHDQPIELAAPVRKLEELLARLDASFTRERQFTSDVSHELRTPLAGLRTLLEVTALADRSGAEYRTALAEALAITIELGSLVDNLLLLARLDHGQLAIAPQPVPLRELAEASWKPHAALAARRGLTFTNSVPAASVADTDRDKLKLVVGNLLANAAEYTAAAGRVTIEASEHAVLDVIDSGPPIPEADLSRLFDRLWRGDAARSATGVHCGIGLSLARSLCDALGYTLSVANLPDGGVRFRIAAQRSTIG